MASSSSSSFKYELFLSFHGEDTRKTFVDHLYAALDRNSICTFKDDKRLEKGKNISDDLLESIENSRFYIIVFSKNYASSSWCLNELVKIMECHKKMNEQTAFPVFYDVEPSDVRKQRGPIGESIAVHESKNEPEVRKWKEALKDAADLSGWHLAKIADGHEAGVIKKIVHDISSKLHGINMKVDENLIGMERRMQDLDSYLQIDSDDVLMIGIKGMGGSGKSTLAGAIFDKICINFEAKSFVQNVREKSFASGLEKLQKQILEDVLKEKDIRVTSVHEGKNTLKTKLKDKKVLIVLDDVDDQDQLEKLAGDLKWFGPGSRIIITTRDAKVLKKLKEKQIYNINLLSDEEAIRLFSRHAFGRDNPIQEYETPSREVVRYAAGLPLTLKTLGSLLYGEDKPEWEDVLARLKTIPLTETLKVLELSYESLDDDQKEIFLDVACFRRHNDPNYVDEAIRVLESCGYHAKNGLRVLQQKSLLTIEGSDDYSFIRMHDHIVEMGQNIVRRKHPNEPNRHSRLWVQEEIEDVLASNLITEDVRCIYLKIPPNTVLKGLGGMTNLRCLLVKEMSTVLTNLRNLKRLTVSKTMSRDHYEHVEVHETSQYFPNSLRYLSFRNYPHKCLPETFEADNLVGLELFDNNIKKLWEGGKVLKKLKFLSLINTKLQSLDLNLMPNLERLHLVDCPDLVEVYVHSGSAKNLAYLRLLCCWSLKSLSFIQELKSLKVLRINQWIGLMMSEIVEKCKFIELRLSEKEILESICSLQHLRTLRLNGDPLLEKLPENVGKLKSLEELDLSGLSSLRDIPYNICKLKHLKKLNLSGCTRLEELPDEIGELESLQELDLSQLGKLRHIPDSICKLNHLKKLSLRSCRHLEKLHVNLGDLDCLQELDIQETRLTYLPRSLCLLKGLKIDGSKLKDLMSGDDLGLPYDFERNLKNWIFNNLELLSDLRNCSIADLPEALGQLECLEELDLGDTKVKHLHDNICMLKHLKKLYLYGCVIEEAPEALGQLECLEELDLSYIKVKHLPESICMLKRLKKLFLEDCVILEKLPEGVGQLESLEELDLSRCYSIREIPSSICMLKHLKILNLENCRMLLKLPDQIRDLGCLQLSNYWDAGISTSTTQHNQYVDFAFEKLYRYVGRLEKPWKLEKRVWDLLEREPGGVGYLQQLLKLLDNNKSLLTCQHPRSIYLQKVLKICGFTFYTQNPDEQASVDTGEELESTGTASRSRLLSRKRHGDGNEVETAGKRPGKVGMAGKTVGTGDGE